MAEVNARPHATPKRKIVKRKTIKGRKKRAERKVVDAVRPKCVARDGSCRPTLDAVGRPVEAVWKAFGVKLHGDEMDEAVRNHVCVGPSEWAHLKGSTRAQTRGQAPERRHRTDGTVMLCKDLHDRYDGRKRPRLDIEALSDRGADGPLRFTMRAK